MNEENVGELTVRSVGFTPIKGTRHLAHPAPEFDDHGPIGDRRFCLVDTDRRQVLKTVRNPSLLGVIARQVGDELETTLPDGRAARAVPEPISETLSCDYWKREVELILTEGPHARLLSSWLGRPVRLALAPRGGVVFGAPISIVAAASLRELAERVGNPGLIEEAARFRATAVIDTDEPFIEETWQGREMTLGGAGIDASGLDGWGVDGWGVDGSGVDGSGVDGLGVGALGVDGSGVDVSHPGGLRVRIGGSIPRCAVIDLDPVTGERSGRLLKALAAYRPCNEAGEPLFGVYAEVVDRAVR